MAVDDKKYTRCYDYRIAKKLGTNPAIVFNTITYLSKNNNNSQLIDGVMRVPLTYDDMHEWLPFISKITIRRAVKTLLQENLISVDHYANDRHKRMNWYSVARGKSDEKKTPESVTRTNKLGSKRSNIWDQNDTQVGSVYIPNIKTNSSAHSRDQNDPVETEDDMRNNKPIDEFEKLDDEHLKKPIDKLSEYSQKRLLKDFEVMGIQWIGAMIKDAYEYHFEGNRRKPRNFATAVRNWMKRDLDYMKYIAEQRKAEAERELELRMRTMCGLNDEEEKTTQCDRR